MLDTNYQNEWNSMKILISAIAFIVVTILSFNKTVFADDSVDSVEQQFTTLRALNTTYAKCNHVATGSGITDKAAQIAQSKKLHSEMLTNHKKMVKLVLESEPKAFHFYTELMNADMLAAFFMGVNTAETNEMVKKDKESLHEKYNFDWRLTHTELWETYNCSGIYSNIK